MKHFLLLGQGRKAVQAWPRSLQTSPHHTPPLLSPVDVTQHFITDTNDMNGLNSCPATPVLKRYVQRAEGVFLRMDKEPLFLLGGMFSAVYKIGGKKNAV